MSLIVSGTSQFLAGQKRIGIAWFLVFPFCGLFIFWCLASPLVPGDLPGLILWFLSMVLWIMMLVKSYRPIPRLRFPGWTVFIALAIFVHVYLLDGVRVFFSPV